MRSEKEIREEINSILALEKENIEEMMDIINNREGMCNLSACINRANEYLNMRVALEWALSDEEE